MERTLRVTSWAGAAGRGSDEVIAPSLSPSRFVAHRLPLATFDYNDHMATRKIYNDVHLQNRIGIREIRQDASIILARVEEGEEFIITNRGVPVGRLIPIDADDDQLIEEMIDSGEIVESDGELWNLPAPTYVVKGKSASAQLMDERASYR